MYYFCFIYKTEIYRKKGREGEERECLHLLVQQAEMG